MLTTLTDQVMGEIPHMRYIDSFDVLEEPKKEPSLRMSQLPDKLHEKGLELSTDPEAFLETYISYQMKPNEDPESDWRLDVIVGFTCCAALINGYLNADNDFMDDLHADGAAAGFSAIPWIRCGRRKAPKRSSTSGTSWRRCSPPATVRR